MSLLHRIGCLFVGHDYWPDRATDLKPNQANRVNVKTGDVYDVDACTIVHQCERCGKEKEQWSPVTTVDELDLPKEWEQ